ncbi:MAG: SIR2 family NAD-dependent protein deacylase [Bacteroidia bacterium]
MKTVVVLTGAGISAESGISTFRDSNGLWENHDVMDVASPKGWKKNPELVLRFYNERRKQARSVNPNAGHYALVELEEKYDVQIITQNVDDLHERAGSTNILHLHGELNKVRSVKNEHLISIVEGDINLGDVGLDGEQLRPHIVWFGEAVPKISEAVQIARQADFLLIIGTSLVVYPAASLIDFVPEGTPIYVIDPNKPEVSRRKNLHFVQKRGTEGVPEVVKELLGLT